VSEPIDLPTLDALHASASTGEWGVYSEPAFSRESVATEMRRLALSTPEFCGELHLLEVDGLCPAATGCGKLSAANAQWIAAVHNAYPAISARIRELEAARDRLATICDEAFGMQPVMSADELLSLLERQLFKRRQREIQIEETLRGIRQEKQDDVDDASTAEVTRDKLKTQIAWIDRVLRGEP
jgi:hypothetical protein